MEKELQNLIIANANKLEKEDICEFLNISKETNTKAQLMRKLSEKVKGNELMTIKLYKDYKEEISLHFVQVEEILHCTETERIRWEREGKLQVAYYRTLCWNGQTTILPYYDIISIYNAKNNVEEWRKEYSLE